jgi:multiple sugar transport system substrate-binding protein
MNQRLRRVTTLTGIAVVAALALGACSSAGAPSAKTAATATPKPTGPITIWVGSWWSTQVDTLQAAWKKVHPEIPLTVDLIPITGYQDKFTAAALGGTPPDIVDLDVSWLSSVANQHLLQPLTDLASTADVKDYAPGPWKASQYKGVQYAIPDRSSSTVLFYNKTMFDNAGVAYPSGNWTFADMLKDAKALTNASKNQYGMGVSADLSDPQNAMDLLADTVWGSGGDFMNAAQTKATINSPKAVAGIQYWANLYTKYKVSPPGTPGFATTRDIVPLFEANQVAMFVGGSNNLPTLDANTNVKYGTVLSPEKVNISGGYTMAVPVGAKNPAAAKVFIKWFNQPKVMAAMMNRTPSRLSALAIAPWNAAEYKVFNNALTYSRSLPSVGTWSEMQTDIITDAQKILVGQSTAKQAADQMETQMTALLAQG